MLGQPVRLPGLPAVAIALALLLAVPTAAFAAAPTPTMTSWSTQLHVAGVVDVSAPRTDGQLVVSGGSRLWLLNRGTGELKPFATGPGGYPGSGGGDEPYLALSPSRPVGGGGCPFAPDQLYVIGQTTHQVLAIDQAGASRLFAQVDGVDSLNGIAFDTAGRFGGRLLVIGASHGGTVVVAIDCRGRLEHVTDGAPTMEGGIAVAPPGFGDFGGDLVGADEYTGQIIAVRSNGTSALVARSGLPVGADTGVEGVGFVPPGFLSGGTAYFADRSTPGNPHPGTDTLLQLDAQKLVAAGVQEGDLLAATEGGARTIAVRCSTSSCRVWEVAMGPAPAHGEGHVIFAANHPLAGAASALPADNNLGAVARAQALAIRAAIGVLAVVVLALAGWLILRWRRRRPSAS
jgi:hypothetical protein